MESKKATRRSFGNPSALLAATFVALAWGLAASCGSEGPESPESPESNGRTDAQNDTRDSGSTANILEIELSGIEVQAGLEEVEAVPGKAGALSDCSLLLVTLDTVRADRIGCYGNRAVETPAIDRLAREGVLFSFATAVTPVTLPSHASVLTGLYPAHHGARANGLFRLQDSHETLTERLKAEGFRTGAFVSSFVLNAQFGLAQGFDHYDDELPEGDGPKRHFKTRRADRTTDKALAWLRDAAEDRFFLWVHYIDPHHDYAPPSPYLERYAGNLYDGEIAFVDSQVKRLMDALGEFDLSEKCLTVVVGDHGEGLGEHHERTHGYLVYESTMRVPMIMHCGSRLGGGVHYPWPMSHVDIMPSVLQLLGLAPGASDGVSLLDKRTEDRPLFFETLTGSFDYGWEPLVGVIRGSDKYIHSSEPELFDLARDPREKRNLAAANSPRAAELKSLLFARYSASLDMTATTVQPSPEDLQSLQALGYAGGGADETDVAELEGLPREKIQLLNRAEIAKGSEYPLERNVAGLQAVLKEDPDFYPAWKGLGEVYVRHGQLEKGAEALLNCLRLKPGTPMDVFSLAAIRDSQKRHAEALQLIEPILEEYPGYLRARHLGATLLGSLGRWPEAAAQFKQVVDTDPDYQDYLCMRQMMDAFAKAGRVDELDGVLRGYLEADPESVEMRTLLVTYLRQFKKEQAALVLLREGRALDPSNTRLTNDLAVLLATSGDPSVKDMDAAIALLEPFAQPGAEDPQLMYTLCALYGTLGRSTEALALAQKTRDLAVKAGMTELVNAIDRRMGGAPPR